MRTPFRRGDQVIGVAPNLEAGRVGTVTHADDPWLTEDDVGVRWEDGVQTVLSARRLGFHGQPDLRKPEEVEAWLSN